ncbi:MAG: family N-acetyltransferase [Nocardioides sp.]|nr:family N-acetyltransferase [Nocardioides sp.]
METPRVTSYVAVVSMPPVAPNPAAFLRPATAHDINFLTDVVIVTARAQGRLPEDFDEDEFRRGFAEWTSEQVAGHLPGSLTSVIEIDGERAGRLRVVRASDHMELAGIQLLPAHQGHGIGTYLIEELLVEARGAGLAARVSVAKDNPRARALYERLGFVVVGDEGDETQLEWAARPGSD